MQKNTGKAKSKTANWKEITDIITGSANCVFTSYVQGSCKGSNKEATNTTSKGGKDLDAKVTVMRKNARKSKPVTACLTFLTIR